MISTICELVGFAMLAVAAFLFDVRVGLVFVGLVLVAAGFVTSAPAPASKRDS